MSKAFILFPITTCVDVIQPAGVFLPGNFIGLSLLSVKGQRYCRKKSFNLILKYLERLNLEEVLNIRS